MLREVGGGWGPLLTAAYALLNGVRPSSPGARLASPGVRASNPGGRARASNLKKRRSPLGVCHELRPEKTRKNEITLDAKPPSFHVCEQKNVEKSPKSIPSQGK